MSELAFLCADRARAANGLQPTAGSPLARALAGAEALGIEDVSLAYGKLEVRGGERGLAVEAVEVVPLTPARSLVLCPYERVAAVRAELERRSLSIVDMTSAFAGLRLRGVTLARRLTDLDLDALPAAGAVARVPALVLRSGEEFRIFFRQELADYLGAAVVDTARGLRP